MANLLESSQTQATSAPQYFTDYLQNIAQTGTAAQKGMQYIGAQPLQTEAFNAASGLAGNQQGTFQAGEQLANQAGATNVTGATQPYLQAGTSTNPLSAMSPYAAQATGLSGAQLAAPYTAQGATTSGLSAASPFLATAATNDPSQMAAQYMNPYINSAVQSMSDIAQRNIRQNLSPQAVAAAVGSGQFGSQRGAQVLGQVQSQAEQDLNSQIANMLSSGYGQALTAAGQQQSLLGQLGSTAGTLTNQQAQNLLTAGSNLGNLQQGANQIASNLAGTAATAQNYQNQANLQAAQTAQAAAAAQGQLQNQAAANLGQIGTQANQAYVNNLNALATLGSQQQTIAQNEQNFPLTSLSQLASLLQGYSVPTTTETKLNMSPLSGLSALGATAAGIFGGTGTGGTGPSIAQKFTDWLKNASSTTNTDGALQTVPTNAQADAAIQDLLGQLSQYQDMSGWDWSNPDTWVADGGSIQAKADGGIVGSMPVMDDPDQVYNDPFNNAADGIGKSIINGQVGDNTNYMGGLPVKE